MLFQRDGELAVPALRELCGVAPRARRGGDGRGATSAAAETSGEGHAGAVLPVRAQPGVPRARAAREPALPLQGTRSRFTCPRRQRCGIDSRCGTTICMICRHLFRICVVGSETLCRSQ